jgi:hypothetical protein
MTDGEGLRVLCVVALQQGLQCGPGFMVDVLVCGQQPQPAQGVNR